MADDKVIPGLGSFGDHVAISPAFDPAREPLTPEEAAVVAAIGRVRPIGEVVTGSGLDANAAIVALLTLRARGVVVKARVAGGGKGVEVNTAMLEEVELDEARKVQVLELEKRLESANHFEILGVPPGADAAAAKAAFFELSRRFHPDRYFGKNLGSFRGRMERIFKRLSEAHQTLTNEEKRGPYLAAHPELAKAPRLDHPSAPVPQPPPVDPAREAERRDRLRRHPYLGHRARVNELVQRAKGATARGDFSAAYTDLATAQQADDRNPEIKTLLTEVKKKADAQRAAAEFERASKLEQLGDLRAALDAYRNASNTDPKNADAAFAAARLMHRHNLDARETTTFAARAVEANPRHVDAHLLLGRLYDAADLKQLSKRHYELALRLAPDNAEAKKAIKGRWPF